MGDISTWDPVDNSNTAAPPDGWPESMQPSAVNNSARAMMGAVRRWYDTVPGSIAAAVANYLPLSGGTLTGTLTAPTVTATGAITGAYIHSMGDIDAGAHLGATSATITNALAATTVNASGAVTAAYVNSTGDLDVGAHFGATSGSITNTLTAGQLTSTGNINAAGTVTGTSFIGNVSVPANGPVTTGGTVTGGQLTSTGNASVAGTITAGSVSASSDVTAAGSVTAGSVHCQGTMQTDGQSNLLGPVFIGPGGAWARIDSSGTYNVTGSWQIISGRAAKENIVDYDARGLAEVLALRPVAFNYRPELFGAEEAEKVRYGLVADEVAEVLPEMVGQAVFGGRHLSTLSMGHLNVVLVRACQDLAAQNAALAARITALEGIQ